MYKKIKQIKYLLGADFNRLPFFVIIFLFASIIDLIGIGLVGPYISMMSKGNLTPSASSFISVLYEHLPHSLDIFDFIGFCLIAAFIAKTCIGIWLNKKLLDYSFSQEVRLRSSLMRSYQNMSYDKFILRNSSEYLYAIQTLTTQFSVNVLTPVMKMLSDGVVIICILLFLSWINLFALILIATLLFFLVYGYDLLFSEKIRFSGHKANEANIEALKSAKEGLLGLKEIRVLGSESFFYERLLSNSIKYARYQSRAVLFSSAPRYMLELVLIIFLVGFVFITSHHLGNFEGLFPTLAIFGFAAMRLIPAAYSCSYGISQIRHGSSSIDLLYDDLKGPSTEIDLGKASLPIPHDRFESVQFKNVSFFYEGQKKLILNNVSLSIKRGEAVGLIGASGSGKTTTIDLLLGLLSPTQGEILYNDRPLSSSINLRLWWRHVAYLPQQLFILDDTLSANVSIGDTGSRVSEALLEESLDRARLRAMVDDWPGGNDTILGEGGVRLSGGQKQRIGIARAFYHGKDFIVMDESTSALDVETEREVIEEIKLLKREKTIIVIAHRLSTVAYCDRILKVENGSIKEISLPIAADGEFKSYD